MQIVGIIPARMTSTRLPGKPLAIIGNKPMIQWVYNQASLAKSLSQVVVATDSNEIATVVEGFGGTAILTNPNHPSGTDRVAEAATLLGLGDDAVIVNIQGDEPFILPEVIDSLAGVFTDTSINIATLIAHAQTTEELLSTNTVKVVVDANSNALYFSRAAIPHLRGVPPAEWLSTQPYYRHLGLYAYTHSTLHNIVALPQSTLELTESLEQLRWLENGYTIKTVFTTHHTLAVDSPVDLEMANELCKLL